MKTFNISLKKNRSISFGLNFWINHRYSLGLLLIIIGTLFKINGSSLSVFANYIVPNGWNRILFGAGRPIRSDEWAVFSPMIASQYFGENSFSAISDIIRGGNTDVALIYGLPVKSLFSILFRPFLNGFLLFDFDRGMAFFWCARLIVLLLVYYDLFCLLTDNNRKLSLIGSVLVSFSPLVQWWFAINGLVEMLIFGAGAVLIINSFFHENSKSIKIFLLFLLYICAGGYLATLYPASMVPLAYVFCCLAGWVIFQNKNTETVKKWDIVAISATVILFLITVFSLYIKHKDVIEIVLNTDYPGKREFYGGSGIGIIMRQWGNMFFPFIGNNIPENNPCEYASMLAFYPLGIFLTVIEMLKSKKTDGLNIAMIIVSLFLLIYCVSGLPGIIAKVSLMKYSTPNRCMAAVGILNIILLVRGMAKSFHFNIHISVLLSACYTVLVIICERWSYIEYLGYLKSIVICFLCFLLTFCIFSFHKRKFGAVTAAIMIAVSLISGAAVNPVQIGCSGFINSNLGERITAVVKEDPDARWIVEDAPFPVNNYPLFFGAPTVNSTNVYPNLELWSELDPTGEYRSVYNRYAHITVKCMDDSEDRFSLTSPDAFSVNVSLDEMAEVLNVKYILSGNDLNNTMSDQVSLKEIAHENDYFIYMIEKNL